jgi:hypothetical protein
MGTNQSFEKIGECLYRNPSSGPYYALVKIRGKQIKQRLKARDLAEGLRDGGKLILDTYSHVRPAHSEQMAKLMTIEKPANVIPMVEARRDDQGAQQARRGRSDTAGCPARTTAGALSLLS